MLEVVGGDRLEVLVDALADRLEEPPADPMAPEWIVVTSGGMQRWLRLRLARRLGRGSSGTDGVAANLDLMFPGRLRDRVLGMERNGEPGPWDLARLPWAVLDVLRDPPSGAQLGSISVLPDGATWWGRARRVADLFDRYALHRPGMVRRWAEGDDVDGVGQRLGASQLWQPTLWRLVRQRIGEASPAELLPVRIAALRDGDCPAGVPERVSLFGIGTVPGGAPFLDLLDALGTQRDVHLLVHRPSPGMAARVRAATGGRRPPLSRTDDRSAEVVDHPLLRSWARPSREAELLLGGHDVRALESGGEREPTTLLSRVQADLRAGTAPTGDFVPLPDDRSVRVHAAHGPTRQVEVLRDQILHLLADDPELTEDDIVVLCPNLAEFAPLIEAALGPSAETGHGARVIPPADMGPPALAYRITDRSLRQSIPLFASMAALIDLLCSRFQAPLLLEFVTLPPVQRRFGFDDDAVRSITDWVEQANVRWGLDGDHRQEGWDVPADYESGTWRAALDRILIGVAVSDDAERLAVGELLPVGVEGSDVPLAGRFAALVDRLATLCRDAATSRPAAAWATWLSDAARSLFEVEAAMGWQMNRLLGSLAAMGDDSVVGGEPSSVDLTIADVRRLLVDALPGEGGTSDFFRGGVTFSSLTPLRAIPARVVCLLGMDEGAFGSPTVDGDDLLADAPHLGDRDRRADIRQALLDAVLAAEDHLVVVRTGTNIVTNQKVPPAVPVAELLDLIDDTCAVAPDSVLPRVEVAHPRQRFDEQNFLDDAERPFGVEGPWSFDPGARAGAESRLRSRRDRRGALPAAFHPPFPDPIDPPDDAATLDLADLHDFLEHPVRHFLREIVGLSVAELPTAVNAADQHLPATAGRGRELRPLAVTGPDLDLELDGLEKWKIKDRWLTYTSAGHDEAGFDRRERARGGLPPGDLGDEVTAAAKSGITPMLDALDELGVRRREPHAHDIDLTLDDGTRIVGSVACLQGVLHGPVRVTAARPKDKHRLAAWLDLLVLTASWPDDSWCSTLVNPPRRKKDHAANCLRVGCDDGTDAAAMARETLALIADCYRRGRREPLPLLPGVSPCLHRGTSPKGEWRSFAGGGDGDDRWVRMAFGPVELEEFLAVPPRADDPPGPGPGRPHRWASYLWDAFDRSVVVTNGLGGEDEA